MKESSLLLNITGPIATLTLNRPEKRNVFDDNTLAELINTLQTIYHDPKIRIVVLKGKGEHFCAGADIAWMQKAAQYSYEENHRDAQKLAEVMELLYRLKKPTITLVQGSVYGGGIGLVACSDIVLAQPNTRFCFSEVKLGLIPAVVGPYVLHAISPRQAKRYMFTAEVFNAQTALSLGLIHEIVEMHDQELRLKEFIDKILEHGPNAIVETKKMVHQITETSTDPTSFGEYTTELIAQIRSTKEAKEGFSAFLEKRQAKWPAPT